MVKVLAVMLSMCVKINVQTFLVCSIHSTGLLTEILCQATRASMATVSKA